jgi:MoxR-like ATPase
MIACEKEIGKEIIGQREVVRTVMLALLTGGNVLLEGMPGLGKTKLVNTISKVTNLSFKRIQFTPDLMPTDVVGTSILNTQTQEFTFRKGPVFTQFLLVDEINRAPAKTQAALFECMEERQVTFDGKTYALPDFYMVMATQNPIDQEGTYRLPEAQMDRFLMKITVGYPSVESELKILQEYHQGNNLHEVKFDKPVITLDELKQMRSMLTQVVVDDSLMKYLCNIVAATRDSTYTWIGGSPRASIALLQTAKAHAILSGRDFVTPDDIHFLAPYILAHRVTLTAEAELNGMTITQLVKQIIDSVAIDN